MYVCIISLILWRSLRITWTNVESQLPWMLFKWRIIYLNMSYVLIWNGFVFVHIYSFIMSFVLRKTLIVVYSFSRDNRKIKIYAEHLSLNKLLKFRMHDHVLNGFRFVIISLLIILMAVITLLTNFECKKEWLARVEIRRNRNHTWDFLWSNFI